MSLLHAVRPVAVQRGAPNRKFEVIHADRAYESDPLRALLAERGIDIQIARRYTLYGTRLGKKHWVVERTIVWLHQFHRPRTAMHIWISQAAHS
jgi:transposase